MPSFKSDRGSCAQLKSVTDIIEIHTSWRVEGIKLNADKKKSWQKHLWDASKMCSFLICYSRLLNSSRFKQESHFWQLNSPFPTEISLTQKKVENIREVKRIINKKKLYNQIGHNLHLHRILDVSSSGD